MKYSLKPLDEQVIVITGASSGIGLATARMAALKGMKVVMAARNVKVLEEEAAELRQQGASVFVVELDITKKEDIRNLAESTINHFGRIDTWVNNAGQSIWGKLADVPEADHRRLFEVNFWGLVDASLIAVNYLRQGGALINIGSILSDFSVPLQGMYAASKHAVQGFTNALRVELEEEKLPISVTLIKPTSINTPLPQHAANYTRHEPKLPGPVYHPSEVATAILYAAHHPCRDLNVGGTGKLMTAISYIAPRVMDWLGEKYIMPGELRDEPPRHIQGTLYYHGTGGQVKGDHPGIELPFNFYNRIIMNPLASFSAAASLGFLAATLFVYQRH